MKLSIAVAMAASLLTGCGGAPADSVGAPSVTAADRSAAVTAADPSAAQTIQTIVLKAKDGVAVHGVFYPAEKAKALILLFHQAGSGKGEYATIAPRLAAAGYSALAIDQRSGGALFGPNETAAGLGRESTYLEAMPDLQAALDWAGDKRLPVIVWGSSYSSALVFSLAAVNPGKVAGVMAFSPGEYLDDPAFVRTAAARVRVPVYVTSAADAGEIAAAKAIFDAVPAPGGALVVPVAGVHGSSTLTPAKNPRGAQANWAPVLQFLSRVAR